MSLATEIQDLIQEVLDKDLADTGLTSGVRDLVQDVIGSDLAGLGVAVEMTYHSADVGQTYDPETGAMTSGSGSAAAYTAPVASGISQELTYYSAVAARSEVYNPETGAYTVSSGDGALWFNNEDNSHWLTWGL